MMKRYLAIAALGLAQLCLSGCFVQPDPMTESEHLARFLEDKAELNSLRDVPTEPITIHEAVARTIKYNLDNRLVQMEAAFSHDLLASANLQMLPKLALNAGYHIRNSEQASKSISYERRVQSLEPSVSTEQERWTGDLSVSWSMLDFGIGYFQAKQQADRFLVMMERRRRIMNNLVKDVISAYFLLASLERIQPEVDQALADANEALETYRRLEESRTGPVAEALERQKSIIMIIRQLRQLHTDMSLARSRLGALMNIPPGTQFSIVPVDGGDFKVPNLAVGLDVLEDLGVFLRPDLREEAYLNRIDRHEVKKEMIRMFPGATLFAGQYYDSNLYLTHNFWAEASGRLTMDILGLAGKYKQYKASKTQVEVSRLRRLANTVAAMVQIDMSYFQYLNTINQYKDSRELNRINERLMELNQASAKTRTIGRMDQLMQSITNVNGKLESDRRLIDVLQAWANLYFSVGCDVLLEVDGAAPLPEIADKAREGLSRWMSGDLPNLPDRPEFNGLCLTAK